MLKCYDSPWLFQGHLFLLYNPYSLKFIYKAILFSNFVLARENKDVYLVTLARLLLGIVYTGPVYASSASTTCEANKSPIISLKYSCTENNFMKLHVLKFSCFVWSYVGLSLIILIKIKLKCTLYYLALSFNDISWNLIFLLAQKLYHEIKFHTVIEIIENKYLSFSNNWISNWISNFISL